MHPATFTGRNFGWLHGERAQAIAHIARVVRGDDGSDQLAQDSSEGLSYRILFTGANPDIPDELRLPPEFRPLSGLEPIRKLSTQWSKWSLPM